MELMVGLISSRHPMPVSEFVYHGPVEDPHDYLALERIAKSFLHEHVIGSGLSKVVLHVTGLGQALSSFLKMWTWAVAAHPDAMPMLDLAHWDRETDDYLRQSWDLMIE
jgi:hypothetical protein